MTKTKMVAYLRVSSDQQERDGTIETQRYDIQKYVKNNNIELVEIYEEVISGASDTSARPVFVEMMANITPAGKDLKAEKEVVGVLIWKLDRLARDVEIQEYMISKLFTPYGLELTSVKEGCMEKTGLEPSRKFYRQMLGAVADYEKTMINLRTKLGKERKREERELKIKEGKRVLKLEGRPGYQDTHLELLARVEELIAERPELESRKTKLAEILNAEGWKSQSKSGLWTRFNTYALLKSRDKLTYHTEKLCTP